MKNVTDLLGKRVDVRNRGYDDESWFTVVTGVIRGVSMITAASFAILIEVEAASPGATTLGLYRLGRSELPNRSLLTVSTDQRYEGHVAIVVLDEAS